MRLPPIFTTTLRLPPMFTTTLGASLLSGLFIVPAFGKGPPEAMIAARQKVFGTEAVNQKTGMLRTDRVIFSWLTNASFAAAMKGHVVLLDSFITRLETTPGRTPLVIQDLVDLRPEAIFLGHGHFDHADNAAFIAQETGAVIYASPETCDNMHIDAANNFARGYTLVKDVVCKPQTARGSLPGSQIVKIDDFEPAVSISVFKHLHSTKYRRDGSGCRSDRGDFGRRVPADREQGQHLPLQSAGPP